MSPPWQLRQSSLNIREGKNNKKKTKQRGQSRVSLNGLKYKTQRRNFLVEGIMEGNGSACVLESVFTLLKERTRNYFVVVPSFFSNSAWWCWPLIAKGQLAQIKFLEYFNIRESLLCYWEQDNKITSPLLTHTHTVTLRAKSCCRYAP